MQQLDGAETHWHDARMHRSERVEAFIRVCVARIAAGEPLSDAEADGFCAILEANERSGHRLLGAMAGPDEAFDTVTGRCGHRPTFRD